MRRRAVLAAVVASACARGNGGTPPSDAPRPIDGARHDGHRDDDAGDDHQDANNRDGQLADTAHLLLSEICLAPDGFEFVEIVNPTNQAVDLSELYLSNHGSYFKLPAGSPALPLDHFIVRFPANATIAAHGIITVATASAASFVAAFGVAPTYSISDGTVARTAINGTPHLTDTGAIVVLFQWDGQTALVRDVDMMIVGTPNATNQLITKSGYTQMGFTYGPDANSIPTQPAAPGANRSTKRIALESGHETQAGVGNGVTGHDETSEATGTTWDASFSAPTPGSAPGNVH